MSRKKAPTTTPLTHGGRKGRDQERQLALGASAAGADPAGGWFTAEQINRHGLKPQQRLAPYPLIDKYPLIIGQNLSLPYLANAYRLCIQGWRYYFVDAMSELIEHDPFTRGVTRQRVLPIGGARVEVYPAKLPKGDKDCELAKTIADEVRRQLDRLPRRSESIVGLAYGAMSGMSGCETVWDKSGSQWEATSLEFIHSRRLNFPAPASWDVHIWDQGAVGPGFGGTGGETQGAFGLRVKKYPGQFVIHIPRLSGEYPTRDGENRYIGFHVALKRMVTRCSAQDFERTIRPWVLGLFNREGHKDSKTVADDDDIAQLELAVAALGNGSLNSSVLPDACDIKILRAASTYSLKDFIAFLKEEIGVSVLGQSFTTTPGAHGNRSAGETARKGTLEINRYDALSLADTLEDQLVYWIVKLNFPGCEKRLLPRVVLNVDQEMDPETLMKIARQGAELDLPIDARDLAERTGLKLIDPEDKDALRTRMISSKDGPNPPDPNQEVALDKDGNPVATDANGRPIEPDDDEADDKNTDPDAVGGDDAKDQNAPAATSADGASDDKAPDQNSASADDEED